MSNRCLVFLLISAFARFQYASGFGIVNDLPFHLPWLQHAATASQSYLMDHATVISSAAQASPIEDIAVSYREALRQDPLQTKVATGIILAIAGDALAQGREPAEYDVKRAVSFAAFDGCYRAVQQFTYPPMIQACSGKFSVASLAAMGMASALTNEPLWAALEQTLVSQLVIIPLVYYPVFYAVTGVVQGLTLEATKQRAKDTFVPLMKRNLLFWIPVQFLTFAFAEQNLQIPILTVCGLAWTVILSVLVGAINKPEEELVPVNDVVLQGDAAYCVTGIEDDCLIDLDDLFHPPPAVLLDSEMDTTSIGLNRIDPKNESVKSETSETTAKVLEAVSK